MPGVQTPNDIAQRYNCSVEDLLLQILNNLPIPTGDPNTFLNGSGQFSTPPASTGGLPAGSNREGCFLYWDPIAAEWQSMGETGFIQKMQILGFSWTEPTP